MRARQAAVLAFLSMLSLAATGAGYVQEISLGGPPPLDLGPPVPEETYRIWPDSVADGVPVDSDTAGVSLGTAFSSSVPGSVTAARFFRHGASTPGPFTGVLYVQGASPTNYGGYTEVARVTFSSLTDSGWQDQDFSAPIAISAGKRYVIAIHYPGGRYIAAGSYFTSPYLSGNSLTAYAGLYRYGSAPGLPTLQYNASTYFSDVVFTPN